MNAAPKGAGSKYASHGPQRAALDAVPVPVAYVLSDGTLAVMNRALGTMLGLSARSAVGTPVELVLGPQAGRWVRSAMQRASTEPVDTEVSLPSPEGGTRWVRLTLEAHRIAGAGSAGASITLVEQERRGDADSADGEELDDLRTMLAAARPAVAVTTADYRLVRWSEAFEQSGLVDTGSVEAGLDLTPALRRHLQVAQGPRRSNDLPDLAAEPDARFAFTAQGAAGNKLAFELMLQPDGRVVVLVTNVGATVELEEELRRSERLRAIGELTGGVAHDFNNLLSVIVGTLDVLEDQGMFGDQRDLVRTAKRSALRGASLTSALLAFGRRGAGHPGPVSPNTVVEGLENVLRRTLGGSVVLHTRLSPDLWNIHADAGLFENAIVNLTLNARDAMPEGGTVTVVTENVRAEDGGVDSVVVSVRDTGVGMSNEVRQRALEAFYTTKGEGKGAGLGLSMVQRFVRAARGRIFIHSEVGRGTEMRMVFPRFKGHTPDTDSEERPAQVTDGHVVLLESDAQVRNTVRTMLMRLGYRVTDTDDPLLAEAMAGQDPSVSVVLVDAGLRGGPDGAQVAQRIQAARPDVRAFLMSGNYSRSDASDVPVLDKPLRLGSLWSALAAPSDSTES